MFLSDRASSEENCVTARARWHHGQVISSLRTKAKFAIFLHLIFSCFHLREYQLKLKTLKKLIDNHNFRILELKNEMVNLEFSEYHFFDDVLSDMKLTPVSADISYPSKECLN